MSRSLLVFIPAVIRNLKFSQLKPRGDQLMSKDLYIGRTELGRTVHARTLEECLAELAHISHRKPFQPFAVGDKDLYYVYTSKQAAEDNSTDWFATVEVRR